MRRDNRNQERYNIYSKKRLQKDIKQKFTTTIISALAHFEQAFGYLWGHEKEGDLTEEERINRDIWLALRTAILDKGHAQRRTIEDELQRYTVTYNKWQTQFKVRDDYGNY